MSTLQFTPEEHASFTQAVRYGRNYIMTLNSYQKDRLGDLAREKQYRAVQVHTERFERQPYDSQEPGQLDYWLNSAPAYVEGQQVLALLAEPAALVLVESAATQLAKKLEKPTTKAKLAILQYLELPQVRSIFEGLQKHLRQPGEWATALVALHACGCLVGNPYEIERWFNAGNFNGSTSRRSIADRQDYMLGGIFPNASEKRIFETVFKDAMSMKKTNE
jgi:hypothetical protein